MRGRNLYAVLGSFASSLILLAQTTQLKTGISVTDLPASAYPISQTLDDMYHTLTIISLAPNSQAVARFNADGGFPGQHSQGRQHHGSWSRCVDLYKSALPLAEREGS